MGINPALLEARAERYRQVLEMRSAGASWGEIGKRFGISRTVARRTWQRAKALSSGVPEPQAERQPEVAAKPPPAVIAAPTPPAAWWLTESGIRARGEALAIAQLVGESLEDYKDRLLWGIK
jgi:hypothetical protein